MFVGGFENAQEQSLEMLEGIAGGLGLETGIWLLVFMGKPWGVDSNLSESSCVWGWRYLMTSESHEWKASQGRIPLPLPQRSSVESTWYSYLVHWKLLRWKTTIGHWSLSMSSWIMSSSVPNMKHGLLVGWLVGWLVGRFTSVPCCFSTQRHSPNSEDQALGSFQGARDEEEQQKKARRKVAIYEIHIEKRPWSTNEIRSINTRITIEITKKRRRLIVPNLIAWGEVIFSEWVVVKLLIGFLSLTWLGIQAMLQKTIQLQEEASGKQGWIYLGGWRWRVMFWIAFSVSKESRSGRIMWLVLVFDNLQRSSNLFNTFPFLGYLGHLRFRWSSFVAPSSRQMTGKTCREQPCGTGTTPQKSVSWGFMYSKSATNTLFGGCWYTR